MSYDMKYICKNKNFIALKTHATTIVSECAIKTYVNGFVANELFSFSSGSLHNFLPFDFLNEIQEKESQFMNVLCQNRTRKLYEVDSDH